MRMRRSNRLRIIALLASCVATCLASRLGASEEAEPNDDALTANVLVPGEIGAGSIEPVADIDYWERAGLVAGDVLFALLTAQSSSQGRDTRLAVFSGSTALLADDDDGGAGLDAVIAGLEVQAGGSVLLRVTESRHEAPISGYELHSAAFSPAAASGETEPNDVAGAADVVVGGFMAGGFASLTDVDTYVFPVEAGDRVAIVVDEDPDRDAMSSDTHLDLLAADGSTLLARGDDSADAPANAVGPWTAVIDGLVFLRITDGGFGTAADYRFAVLVNGSGLNSVPTVLVTDENLYVSKASFKVDWKAHANGKQKDEIGATGRLNRAGLEPILGPNAAVSVRLAGVDIVGLPIPLNSKGAAVVVANDGTKAAFSLNLKTGDFELGVSKADLRAALGIAEEYAQGAGVAVEFSVELSNTGITTPITTAAMTFTYDTKPGKASTGTFKWKVQGLLSGAFRTKSVMVKQVGTSTHRVDYVASTSAPLAVPLIPLGAVVLTLGNTTITVPHGALEKQGSKPEVTRITLTKGSVPGLDEFTIDNKKRLVTVSTTAIPATGVPMAGDGQPVTHALVLQIAYDDGVSRVFTSSIELLRGKPGATTWSD